MCDDRDIPPKEVGLPSYRDLLTAIDEANERVALLTADLKEWTDTFAPYGSEPQACLHTLLKQQPVSSSITDNAAQAWFKVWDVIKQTGLPDSCDTCIDQAIRHIRYLYEQATKPPKPEPPKSERDRLLQDVRYYEFKRGVAFAQLDSIKMICEHIQEALP